MCEKEKMATRIACLQKATSRQEVTSARVPELQATLEKAGEEVGRSGGFDSCLA